MERMDQIINSDYGRIVVETILVRWSVCFFFTIFALASSRGATGKGFKPLVRFFATAMIMSVFSFYISQSLFPKMSVNNVIFISFVSGAIGDFSVEFLYNTSTQKWLLVNILDRILSVLGKSTNTEYKLPEDIKSEDIKEKVGDEDVEEAEEEKPVEESVDKVPIDAVPVPEKRRTTYTTRGAHRTRRR